MNLFFFILGNLFVELIVVSSINAHCCPGCDSFRRNIPEDLNRLHPHSFCNYFLNVNRNNTEKLLTSDGDYFRYYACSRFACNFFYCNCDGPCITHAIGINTTQCEMIVSQRQFLTSMLVLEFESYLCQYSRTRQAIDDCYYATISATRSSVGSTLCEYKDFCISRKSDDVAAYKHNMDSICNYGKGISGFMASIIFPPLATATFSLAVFCASLNQKLQFELERSLRIEKVLLSYSNVTTVRNPYN